MEKNTTQFLCVNGFGNAQEVQRELYDFLGINASLVFKPFCGILYLYLPGFSGERDEVMM